MGNGRIGIQPLQETSEVTNNLSFPVIWSDGVALFEDNSETSFNGKYFVRNDTTWYLQGDREDKNIWQAETRITPTNVSIIDWGDNLEAKSWPAGSQVRVEVALYKILDDKDSMKCYLMTPHNNEPIIDPTQSLMPNAKPIDTGTTEIWGAYKVKADTNIATIYSSQAMLVIQKLIGLNEGETPDISWSTDRWSGENVDNNFIYKISVPEGSFSAEVNVQGKVIYGHNWLTEDDANGPGTYRITFVLLNKGTASIDDGTAILGSDETVETPEESQGGRRKFIGGEAKIDPKNNLTYIDVQLSPTRGGGNTGSGGGGGLSHGNKGQGGGNTGNHGHNQEIR